MKYHVAAELQGAIERSQPIRIIRWCLAGRRPYLSGGEATWTESTSDPCPESLEETWLERWDAVRVERRVDAEDGHRVPDIVLLENGRPVAAIEIVVSHAVDSAKAEMLARLGLPWIEIRAESDKCSGENAWKIEQPLEPVQADIALTWRCESHAAAARSVPRPTVVSEGPASGEIVRSARLVDVYFSSGSVVRIQYCVTGVVSYGLLRRLALERNGRVVTVHLLEAGESQEAFSSRVAPLLQSDYEADLRRVRRRAAFVDSPMRWLKGDERSRMTSQRSFPERFRFNAADRAWEPVDGLREARWPVEASKQSALAAVETAIRGRRRGVQRGLTPPDSDQVG